jgi:hypothetical protein
LQRQILSTANPNEQQIGAYNLHQCLSFGTVATQNNPIGIKRIVNGRPFLDKWNSGLLTTSN